MNIWLISKYASLPKYGTGARLFYLSKEIGNLGHNSLLITSDSNHLAKFPSTNDRYNFETIEGTSVIWIKTKKYLKTASLDRILSWFDFEWKLFHMPLSKFAKPEIVIVSSLSIFTIFYGYYLKKKYNAFLVFEIRDIWPLTMTEEAGFNKYHPLVLFIGFIEKFGYKNADLIVGTMPRLDLHVKNILGYERIFYCSPLGFNSDNYMEETQETSSNSFDFPKDKIIIGYAGSMGITNALESYIECIKLLNIENPNIHFVLVGSGDLKSQYESDLKECSNVTFLPRIIQSEVKYLLANCDILYLSAQDSKVWEYGQSMNKVVEYMLAKKPIIARYSGFPSMIDEADCGMIVNSNNINSIKDAILSLSLKSPEERRIIGERGKDWIFKNRKYDKLAAEYLTEIERLRSYSKKTVSNA
jgi:glycosyltransferase involved in cell wall biosynthesis